MYFTLHAALATSTHDSPKSTSIDSSGGTLRCTNVSRGATTARQRRDVPTHGARGDRSGQRQQQPANPSVLAQPSRDLLGLRNQAARPRRQQPHRRRRPRYGATDRLDVQLQPAAQSPSSSVTGFRVGCQKFDLYKFGKCGITLARCGDRPASRSWRRTRSGARRLVVEDSGGGGIVATDDLPVRERPGALEAHSRRDGRSASTRPGEANQGRSRRCGVQRGTLAPGLDVNI